MSIALPAFIFGQKELTNRKEEKKRVDIKPEKDNIHKYRQTNKHLDRAGYVFN